MAHEALRVDRTRLVDPATGWRHAFRGLFVSRRVARGALLGVYSGVYARTRSADGLYHGSDPYAMSSSTEWYVRPSRRRGEALPDGAEHPIAMINEGPEQNAFLHEYARAEHVTAELPRRAPVVCLAVHACRDLEAGEEVYRNYGAAYDRSGYDEDAVVGRGCSLPRRELEWPIAFERRTGRRLREGRDFVQA